MPNPTARSRGLRTLAGSERIAPDKGPTATPNARQEIVGRIPATNSASAKAAIMEQARIEAIGLPERCTRYPPDGMARIVNQIARLVREAAVVGDDPCATSFSGA